MLTFNEATHEYFLDGNKLPGVSEIIKTVGLSKDFSGVDPFYRDRGKAVHSCIELFLLGTIDETSIDPVCRPFYEGFLRYWDKYATKPIHIEEKFHANGAFAGTVDLVTGGEIIDWKCSKSHDPAAEIQGEAYKVLVGKGLPFKVVQFPGDGTYKVYEYGSGVDYWPSVMKLYEWKTKGKRKNDPDSSSPSVRKTVKAS